MEQFESFWSTAVDIAWGLPLVVLLVGAGIYFTAACRFLPFRGLRHAFNILRGKYDREDDPGEISHFQALSSALSATIGMGNIAGVAIAISVGGPGAIFWMWIAGLVGMSTKFFTCTLATMYRKKDENGVDQGGPMYYLEVGLGKYFKPLAILFAICGMIGCLSLFQVNQLSGLLHADYGWDRVGTGVVCMILVGIVILGGIKRVGVVAAKVVPAMFLLYIGSAIFIVLANASAVPDIFASIFKSAFGGEALLGGGAGVAFAEVMKTGIRRAAFSNEAGVGTAPMAHGAAKTKEPVREGLIAMLGPFLDTNLVCTLTALVILSSGVLSGELGSSGEAVVVTVNAFTAAMGPFGRYLLTLIVVLFSVSTMISYSYYSLKCARYLFGIKVGGYYVYVYLLSLPLAAWLGQDTVVNIIDTCFALMAIPTLTGALLLSGKVVAAVKDYYQRMGL
ncbi:MAG: sodium:alanine symporter family protein [candidate division Zixibacteria bacterium]|nr:sodium:alanine symporter family protein [candidate division Zixibacteria bacterium]